MRGVGGGAWCFFRSSAEHVGSDSPGRGRSTPKVVKPRHEPRAQHAVALARSAKPGPRAKPGAHLIRMQPTSHPRRDTSAPHVPKAQSTSATTAHFHQFPPKWTTVRATTQRLTTNSEAKHGGFCDHRPTTRRRHAARSLLWSQFPPHLRVGTHLEHDHTGRDTLNTGHLRTPRAQSAVHLSYNSPFSPVLTKVDDGLSSNPKLRPS